MNVPVLETERFLVREFEPGDLEAVHELLDVELGPEGALTREERHEWLTWTVLGYRQLAQLHQPPYGDRAIVLKETGQLIGACGYAPVIDAFGQIPSLRGDGPERPGLTSSEVVLYYALSPSQRGRGYATEAARALVDHAFARLRLARIVATTTSANTASMGVMRRLGMRIERNPRPTPAWLQVVGVLDHPEAGRSSPMAWTTPQPTTSRKQIGEGGDGCHHGWGWTGERWFARRLRSPTRRGWKP